jgi:hypothetical protein
MMGVELVQTAYRKFKRNVFYEKNDLALRERLAQFECNDEFDEKVTAVAQVLDSVDPVKSELFQQWLEEIKFRLVPKQIKPGRGGSEQDGRFITNVTSQTSYEIARVNYFFDGPVELHLIAVMWLMTGGFLLDRQLTRSCFGARLHEQVGTDEDRSAHLFRKYHELYSRWRDSGIQKAKSLLLDERKSVYILGLDIREYFYRVKINYVKVQESIEETTAWQQRMEGNKSRCYETF